MRSYLRLDLSDSCNIRCIMCQSIKNPHESKSVFLDFEIFKKQTKGHLREWSTIQIGNQAEPTIHPQFGEFIQYIREESDATIHIVTNGKLLDKFADIINEAHCFVQISIDSLKKDIHEYIRSGSNYDKLFNNISLLDTNKVKILLSFTLMRSNIGEYGEIVDFCNKKKYQLGVFPMILRDFWGIIPLNLIEESLWFHKTELKEWLKEYYGKEYDNIVGASAGKTVWHPTEFTCDAHSKDLIIDAQGNATLCYQKSLPCLYKMTLEEIWNSVEAESFRKEIETNRAPCIECKYRQKCLAPSMSLLENHFCESIVNSLSTEVKKMISFNSPLSDSEQKSIFIKNLSKNFILVSINKYGHNFYATTLKDYENTIYAKNQADLSEKILSNYHIPKVLEIMGEYTIISYMNKYWAVPLSFGPFDLQNPLNRALPSIIIRDTLQDLKEQISADLPPQLLETFKIYNIVSYMNKYWAVPLFLGHLDLHDRRVWTKPGIICHDSKEELMKHIEMVLDHP